MNDAKTITWAECQFLCDAIRQERDELRREYDRTLEALNGARYTIAGMSESLSESRKLVAATEQALQEVQRESAELREENEGLRRICAVQKGKPDDLIYLRCTQRWIDFTDEMGIQRVLGDDHVSLEVEIKSEIERLRQENADLRSSMEPEWAQRAVWLNTEYRTNKASFHTAMEFLHESQQDKAKLLDEFRIIAIDLHVHKHYAASGVRWEECEECAATRAMLPEYRALTEPPAIIPDSQKRKENQDALKACLGPIPLSPSKQAAVDRGIERAEEVEERWERN